MNELKIKKAKLNIVKLLKDEDDPWSKEELGRIEEWISSRKYVEDLDEYDRTLEKEKILDDIVEDLKSTLPLEAILPSEEIHNPDVGSNADCSPDTTIHIDDFLYPNEDIDKYFPDKTKYCEDCGSRHIKDTTLISHSLSRMRLQYLYNVMLPQDCSDKSILDVGSRIGAVLYGGYFYSNSKNIYGVEMNTGLYEIQKKIVSKHNMDDRIRLINDDIINQEDLVGTADILILNNVFEFFIDTEKQIDIWKFFKRKLKKDCILITIPCLESTFMELEIFHELKDWLTKIPIYQNENMLYDEDEEAEFHDMYMYIVK